MAKRYSGNATVQVTYRDSGDYKCLVSIPRERGNNKPVWSAIIRPPAIGFGPGVAYDSPEAYSEVARSALSFASNENSDVQPDYNEAGSSIVISRIPVLVLK